MVSRRAVLRAGALLPLAAGCGTGPFGGPGAVRIAVAWSGGELAAFRSVLDALELNTVEVVPLGDDIDTAFGSSGREAPDIVMMPQIGQVQTLAARGRLRESSDQVWQGAPYEKYWERLLFHDGKPYGAPFKVTAKSLVWFDREGMATYGLGDPAGWSVRDWVAAAGELSGGPVRFLAPAGADGWSLTDSFENMLLAEAPGDYAELAESTSPRRWDRRGVRAALSNLGALWGVRAERGIGYALTRQFPDAVREVFDRRTALMVVMPDFAEPIVRRCLRHARRADEVVGTTWFPPAPGGVRPHIVGGDVAVVTARASDTATEVVAALAGNKAAKPWIEGYGGFIGPHRDTEGAYSRMLAPVAGELAGEPAAEPVFELSERIGAMGGRHGLWPVLTGFLTEVGDGAKPVESAVERAVAALDERERRPR
ncbi:ABC transporter substrate-binding protein [Nocardia harenae]|uniref:ABC transporter substrate-binding protein n=1 Tax=Nocardia harenae TaxID=358707 RepID=UPI00083526CC|nr:ABC transporter substrate-binding protein [Nocardia harenae]